MANASSKRPAKAAKTYGNVGSKPSKIKVDKRKAPGSVGGPPTSGSTTTRRITNHPETTRRSTNHPDE